MDRPYESTLAMLEELRADVAESDGKFEVAGSAAEDRGVTARACSRSSPPSRAPSPSRATSG